MKNLIELDKKPEQYGIWHPIYEFENFIRYEQRATRYGKSKLSSFWYNQNKSLLYYSEHFELTFGCRFNFESYPIDQHECRIEYGHYWPGAERFIMNSSIISYNGSEIE